MIGGGAPFHDPTPVAACRHRTEVLLILIFGILSLVVCGVFGPFAWIMGNNDLAQIRCLAAWTGKGKA